MSYEQWQNERRAAVTSRTGNLALVGYQPVRSADPQPIDDGIPASVALASDGRGVLLTARAEDGVTVDGEPVDGTVTVGLLTADGTPIIACGRHSIDVFSLDGSDLELRIYDSASENLENFDHIAYYDEDPALALRASFRPHASSERVAWDFTRASDAGHTKQVPGVLDVEIDGVRHELAAFLDGSVLVLVFADGTTGAESYAPGRFLKLPMPDGAGEGAPVAVTLDFNRCFIPPCGFSDFYSCPIPPAQNRIGAPIRAGERSVEWKRPRY